MLGVTSVLTAALTAQAALAARYQRVSAERVLHDYAALGAEGVAQRLKSALGGRINGVFNAAAKGDAGNAPGYALRDARSDALRAVGGSGNVLRLTPSDSLASTVRAATAALPSYAYFGMIWLPPRRVTPTTSERDLLVFQPMRDGSPQPMAFALPERAVDTLMATLVARDPVLPASVTHGAVVAAGAGLRVVGTRATLADRHFDATSPFRATLALGQPFGDLAVEVSLSESIAPTLVIGGLPRSRVPLLASLLVLTVALTAAAADQIRRELELSRLREDFVSGVSHELRTPLAQIRLFAETIRLGRVRSPEESDRSLSIIENEVRRLEHLVENLLHFSRAERSALRVHPTQTNLTSLLQDIVGEFIPLAARSESTIALELEPDVLADVDSTALRQIVLNLLDNAVKYGTRGQTISVRLSTAGNRARIEVEDQGLGIAAGDRAKIWERFWRGESARGAGIAGTGVGLAIVNDLVTLHHGAASAHGPRDGTSSGTCVVVDLPLREERRGALREAPA